MRKSMVLFVVLACACALRAEEKVIGYDVVYAEGSDVPVQDLRLANGGTVTAPWHRFVTDGGNMTLTMEPGSGIYASADFGKREMPCDDVEYAVCLGYGPGYVIANLGGGEIVCTNGLFCVAKEAYTTCMVTGTVIRCRGFRLQTGRGTGYATFILGEGGELDITGEWGIRGYHDPDIQTNYVVGARDFRYYFELRGGKIKFEESYLSRSTWSRALLDHAPCLIMAPDTTSEFEVAEGRDVYYAGQLQGEGTLRKTGKGNLVLASGFIRNEGAIVVEEGSLEMFMESRESRFWGDVIVKPGAKLLLRGQENEAVPSLIEVCRSGALTVEDGAEVWYYNKTTGTTTLVDLNANATNGGYIENRSTYRIGVSMNLGTVSWGQMGDEIDDPYVGAYPEPASLWGRQREVGSALGWKAVSDIMRIYARSDIQKFIKLSFWAGDCHRVYNGADPLTNGNQRVTNNFLDDGIAGGKTPVAGAVVATNYLYAKEQVVLDDPGFARNWQVRLQDIPYAEFSLYLIFTANNVDQYRDTEFAPVMVRLTTPDGLHSSAWTAYTYDATGKTTDVGSSTWGGTEGLVSRTNLVEGTNYLCIHFSATEAEKMGLFGLDDLSGATVDVAPGATSSEVVQGRVHQIRCCLAGVQIVPDGEPMPELDINEYTSFTADQNIYGLRDGDPISIHFTATNENAAIGFVHAFSNDVPVASRVLVDGREFPKYPGAESRYDFNAANTDKLELNVKYLPWRDNQTNDLTMAQFAWVTNRWQGNGTVATRTLNSATAIAGADSDGDDFPFQFEYVTDSDLTKNSDPMHLVIVGRAVSNDCLWLDVEYTRTEDGIAATNAFGEVRHGWLGRTNGCDNAEFLHLGMRRGARFSFTNDVLKAYKDTDEQIQPIGSAWRGPNPTFEHTITNTIVLPLTEMTNRYFRAVMEAK